MGGFERGETANDKLLLDGAVLASEFIPVTVFTKALGQGGGYNWLQVTKKRHLDFGNDQMRSMVACSMLL